MLCGSTSVLRDKALARKHPLEATTVSAMSLCDKPDLCADPKQHICATAFSPVGLNRHTLSASEAFVLEDLTTGVLLPCGVGSCCLFNTS